MFEHSTLENRRRALFDHLTNGFISASIVFWNTTQQIDHNCFGEQTAANMEMMKQRVRRDDKIEQLDDVRKVNYFVNTYKWSAPVHFRNQVDTTINKRLNSIV